MSRCFPFPPPGYEKKPRPDDGNLLIKEKHREKKHKKEKKDKDKKERKEKKDKEQSGEKRREKKEKKNKHKDKKDKERDKEKQRISEEKKVLGTSEHQNGRKPSPTGMQCNDSQPMFLLELEKRLRNKDGATESKMVGKIVAADEGCFRFQGKVTERNFDILSDAKEKFKDKRDDHRMVSGQTLKVVARASENGVGPHVMGEDEKKVEGGFYQVEKVNEKEKERREKKKHKDGDGKRDKHQDRDQNKQNKSKDRKGEKGKEKEEKAIEKRCKLQIKQSSIDTVDIHGNGPLYLSNESRSKGNLGKRKDPETNGVLWDDDSRSDKLPRPVSSSHQVMQNGSKCDSSQTAVQFAQERQDIVQDHKVNAKVSFHQSVLQNGKKMDPAHIVNGFMSEQKITFNNHKVQNGILHSQRVGGTGKNPESCQAAMNLTNLGPGIVGNHNVNNNVSSLQPDVANQTRSNGSQAIIYTTAERQGIFSPHKVDGKKSMINGVIKTEESKKIKEKSKTHKRPPHPDSKYLSQILTVPEVEWSDFDDQEWLFSSSDSKTKKPRTVSTKIEEAKLVWAEALPMESSDVVALPYVIPY